MKWLEGLFSSSVGSAINSISNTVDKFITTPDEKAQLGLELQRIMNERDKALMESLTTEMESKERVLIAELQSGDNYTRRARPTMAYGGLAIIFFNYCFAPLLLVLAKIDLPELVLPEEFWFAWTGIVATWSIGRSAEKRKTTIKNPLLAKGVSFMTGASLDK